VPGLTECADRSTRQAADRHLRMAGNLMSKAWPVSDLLTHRDPMIFIDRVLKADRRGLVAEVRIESGKPFYEEGVGVPAWVGLEYMAQSIAAFSGLKAKAVDQDVPPGLLIGCREYSSDVAVFPDGAELTISVSELDVMDGSLGAFDCTIGDTDIIVTARLMVYGRT
jgi:predicted hotdog family 3-hydroxylacyl-ACP dehydratase